MSRHGPPVPVWRSWLAARRRPRPRTLAIAAGAVAAASIAAMMVAPAPLIETRDPAPIAASDATRTPRYERPTIPSIGPTNPWMPPEESAAAASSSSATVERPAEPTRCSRCAERTAPDSSAPSSPTATPPPRPPDPPARPPAPPAVVEPEPEPEPAPEPDIEQQPTVTLALLELVNRERLANGCGPVSPSADLQRSAQQHADAQAADDSMHHSADAGVLYGENVAAGYPNAMSVHEAWMASPDHRANILNCSYVWMGAGATDSADSIRYWTEQFTA